MLGIQTKWYNQRNDRQKCWTLRNASEAAGAIMLWNGSYNYSLIPIWHIMLPYERNLDLYNQQHRRLKFPHYSPWCSLSSTKTLQGNPIIALCWTLLISCLLCRTPSAIFGLWSTLACSIFIAFAKVCHHRYSLNFKLTSLKSEVSMQTIIREFIISLHKE